jgi:hypothetical protein
MGRGRVGHAMLPALLYSFDKKSRQLLSSSLFHSASSAFTLQNLVDGNYDSFGSLFQPPGIS